MAIVFAVVTITFFVVHLAQGTPCGGERPLPPDVCERERAVFGYDKPLQVQYVKYLAALLHGKMGYSFGLHRPVADALADAIPNTFTLALAALLIDFALGLALGIYQAVRAGRFGDVAVGNVALLVNSMPVFWLGLVLLLVFAQWLRWLHGGGPDRDGVRVARDGPARRECDLPARLPRGDRRGPAHERDGGAGQPDRRCAVCRGRPADPGAGRRGGPLNIWNWLAVGGAAVLALGVVAALRRRVRATAPGRRFFRHPTAGPGVVGADFFVTLPLAATRGAPYPPDYPIDLRHPH